MANNIYKTTGTYKKGVVTLSNPLPLDEAEVFLTIKPKRETKGNAKEVLKALEKVAGTMPMLPEGTKFVREIREESEKRFKRLNW